LRTAENSVGRSLTSARSNILAHIRPCFGFKFRLMDEVSVKFVRNITPQV